MFFLSVCSGIEAASVAWAPLGWKPLAFSEIDSFPRAILQHRFPDVPLHGDFTRLRDEPWIVDADVLVGGTPCQGFSVAGLRGSLDDDRSNLCLEFVRLADAVDDLRCAAGRPPAWILWENVPGVLSTQDNAFGAFLAGLCGSQSSVDPPPGRGWTDAGVVSGPRRTAAFRCLDAQHFGLAQRRKRVFVLALGHPRGWAAADALLPVGKSLQGHSAPRRKAGKRVARPLASSSPGGSGYRNDADTADNLIAVSTSGAGYRRNGIGALRGRAQDSHENLIAGTAAFGGGNTSGSIDVATARNAHAGPHGRLDFETETFVFDPQGTGGQVAVAAAAPNMAIRRLLPVETERLQGLPDNWTLAPWRGKPAEECPDGPRYRAIGNSFAVPVVRWIGARIQAVTSDREVPIAEAAE